ncbi:MAG: SlyX protein [Candidatus Azotimanducaceae bacterium]|jgi:SlyX protein
MSETRFEILETKVAFQEELIQQLDDAVIAQQRQINEMHQLLKILKTELTTLETQVPDSEEPPPPHY